MHPRWLYSYWLGIVVSVRHGPLNTSDSLQFRDDGFTDHLPTLPTAIAPSCPEVAPINVVPFGSRAREHVL